MLDLKFVRDNIDQVKLALANRGGAVGLDGFLALEQQRRDLLVEVEGLKSLRNNVTQEISRMKQEKLDANDKITQMRQVGEQISGLDASLKAVEQQLTDILMTLPNLPDPTVPVGKDEQDNVEIRRSGQPRQFDFTPLPHWEIGERLGILDFERAAKVTGARFTFYKGLGARLERALINFFLDIHTQEHGYTEILPPFIANRDTMTGTGQLPKFADDMFKLEGHEYFLIPTAEVPVTNMHRQEVLNGETLPLYYTAYSACFRAEAGAAGRDTRGLIRQHQFNKVELVKFSMPENSFAELELMTNNAERVLSLLGLPYRTILLCTGDMGFSAAKTYDIEVWLPSFNTYREISSCSNCCDFQARRADIRFRREPKSKLEFVHTLNGSGVAIGRALSAILENYQQADGSVIVPEVLRPFMGVDIIR